MKNTLYYLLACVVVFTMSCRDEELDPWPKIGKGAFVQVEEVITPVFDLTDLGNTAYEFSIDDEVGNVASYAVSVSWNGADTVLVKTVTEFPSTVSIKATEIADAYGVSVEEFEAGDRFDFVASSTGTDGSVYGVTDITGELLGNPRQKQGYRFVTYVSCPFDANELAGTYLMTRDVFEVAVDPVVTVEVVAGPGENEFTIKDPYGHGDEFEMIVSVNPNTGQTTVARQNTYSPANWGAAFVSYGKGYSASTLGNGFAFSCAGLITINFAYSVDIGSFSGLWNYTLEKQ